MVQSREHPALAILKPIQVSPRSFKRQLEVVIGALAQLNLRTTILAKLPQASGWFEDLKHYSQSIHPTPEVFLFSRQLSTPSDWFTAVSIPKAYPMQGEYELIAIAENVGLMLLGYRESSGSVQDDANSAGETAAEDADSPTLLNFSITMQPELIAQRLEELRQVVQASLLENANQPLVRALVAKWEERLRVPTAPHPGLIDALLLRQGEYQEGLQKKARVYRRQAMTASSLSTQNEALLNTLRLKDDFLNNVGQALRTPLSTIKTALPLLSSPNLKPPQRQRYLEMISQECDRQSSLINGVLDLLQVERSLTTATPEPVKLFDVVPGVVSTYQPLAQEKGIRLAYTVPNSLPAVCCPENWIRQIVIQLLNNSIRYTDAGGEVWVTVQDEDDESLLLNVKDTGAGIPPNELPHIFDHFYRGRQPSQEEDGAGLGLTIVQQLLLYCGGQISVESQPGVGTHFQVRLPLYRED